MVHVIRYRPGGAATYLTELRADLARCSSVAGKKWTLLGTASASNESLLIRTTEVGGYQDSSRSIDHYITVTRVGDVLLVVADMGWEMASGSEQTVRSLTTAAVNRARNMN
ncbi:MAG: hypothetical protein H0T78_01060 [Longispora sp.]|nr:hypothetical protein [Longispora sp. (in: high G+C Gram-positive bacteria)]